MATQQSIEYIEHDAVVVSTNPARNSVKVRFDDADECGECPAAKMCQAAGQASNTIDITDPYASRYRKGDIVTVRGTEQMHRKAVMYATVLPCIALVAVMVAVYILTFNQLAAALTGVGVTVAFYVILWLCRDKIAHEFCFTITGHPERKGNEKTKS